MHDPPLGLGDCGGSQNVEPCTFWFRKCRGSGYLACGQAYSDEHPVQKVEEVEVPKKIKARSQGVCFSLARMKKEPLLNHA